MAISVTGIATGTGGVSSTTFSITVPAGGVPSGALLLAFLSSASASGTPTISDTASNSFTSFGLQYGNGIAANGYAQPWYAKNCNALSSGNTIVFTYVANFGGASGSAIYATGIDTTAPLDTSVTATAGGSSTTPSVTSGTPGVAGELFVSWVFLKNLNGLTTATNDTGHGWTAPFSKVAGGAYSHHYAGYQINSGSSAITYAPTFSVTGTWATGVAGFKAAVTASVGASAGVGSATSVGAPLFKGVAASAGVGSATAVGQSQAASPGVSNGVGSATSVGASTSVAVGAASGVGSSTAVGNANFAGVGASAGVGTATADGASSAASVGASAGTGGATSVGAASSSGVGSTPGVGGSSAVGLTIGGATGSASGIGAASGVGVGIAASVGVSVGLGTATSVGASIAVSLGASSGVGIAVAVGNAANGNSSGAANGIGSASATGQSIADSIGWATGTGTATSVGNTAALGSEWIVRARRRGRR